MEKHINPWNYPVKIHTYEEYEDEFRAAMKRLGCRWKRNNHVRGVGKIRRKI
jgi:hypothetical protein